MHHRPRQARVSPTRRKPRLGRGGANGTQSGPVTPGFTGTLMTSANGLVPSTVSSVPLTPTTTGFDPAKPAVSPSTKKVTVTVPTGTTLLRYATYDADVPAGTDVDLYVYQAGTTKLVGISAGGTAEENVTVIAPAAGAYDVYVDLFSSDPVTARLNSFLVAGATGNLTVSPASRQVTVGQPFMVSVTHRGLATGKRWLGWGAISDGTANRITIVSGRS